MSVFDEYEGSHSEACTKTRKITDGQGQEIFCQWKQQFSGLYSIDHWLLYPWCISVERLWIQ